MSYISAYHDKRVDKVFVWERKNGHRVRTVYDAPHYFYVADDEGTFTAINGQKLKKVVSSAREFDNEVNEYKMRRIKTFESDISPLERILIDVYSKVKAPSLNIGFIDIELDYIPSVGHARPTNPYAPINAVTISKPDGTLCALAVPPQSWRWGIDKLPVELESDPTVIITLFKNEEELVRSLIRLIREVDVLSGWTVHR